MKCDFYFDYVVFVELDPCLDTKRNMEILVLHARCQTDIYGKLDSYAVTSLSASLIRRHNQEDRIPQFNGKIYIQDRTAVSTIIKYNQKNIYSIYY